MKPASFETIGFYMDWKLHVILSLFLYFLIISFSQFSLIYSVQALLILVFSSLLPDLDHPKSMIRKITFILVFYLMMLFIIIELAMDVGTKALIIIIILILAYYIYKNLPLKHRGKRSLHLWRYCFLFGGISLILFALANINITFALFIIVGYASHLISDRIRKF